MVTELRGYSFGNEYLTFFLNVWLFAMGKAVSPPSSTSLRKYRIVMYLKQNSIMCKLIVLMHSEKTPAP